MLHAIKTLIKITYKNDNMIVTDLFRSRVVAEALEQPITTGFLNPATGKPYLPSELAAKRQQRAVAAGRLDAPQPATVDPAAEAEKIRKEKQAAAAQAAQDEMDDKAIAATPGASAFGAMAQQLGGLAPANTMANAPVSSTNVAKPGNPNAAAPVAAPASTPTVPSLTSTPAKVEPLATAPAAPTPTTSEPISIGGQTIKPTDPLYAQIMQNAPAGTFDAPEVAPAAAAAAPELTNAERIAVKDIAVKASDMLKTVQTKDDLAKVKAFIDREFAKQGNKYMSEAMFFNRDRLMEQATRIYHRRIS